MSHLLRKVVAALLLAFELPLVILVVTTPPTWWAVGYLVGVVVLSASLLVEHKRRAALVGVSTLLAVALLRIALVKPMGHVRVIDRLIDERDVALNGARALGWTGFSADPDIAQVPGAMRSAYAELGRDEGDVLPSPVAATYLGLEHPGASDVLELAHAGDTSDAAVVFLHGFTGNFTMTCWLFARAAQRATMRTICPSTGWAGDWWTADGEAIVRETIATLRRGGTRRVYLAGLSNGATGASILAPKLGSEIAGLVLVSGGAPDADAPGVPTLVVQGQSDHNIPAAGPRSYAERTGARYVELTGGHFVLMLQRDRAADVIGSWLHEREARMAP